MMSGPSFQNDSGYVWNCLEEALFFGLGIVRNVGDCKKH